MNPSPYAQRALQISLALYSIALLTSMAGMEIFGWLSAVLVLVFLGLRQLSWFPLLKGDWALLALFAVVSLGAVINTPEPKSVVDIVGSFRFVVLFLLLRVGLSQVWSDKLQSWVQFLMLVSGIIGVYGVYQYFSGLDILRGESHRAVQILQFQEGVPWRFRSAGLLSSPMTYAYSAGLFVCLPLAFLLTHFKDKRWRYLSGFAAVAGSLSLITSMTRGAWLALAAAIVVMAFYLGRKVAVPVLLTGALALTALASANSEFRHRLASIANPQMQSRLDRELIWQANFAMFRDYPILGVGYGENERLIDSYYERLGLNGQMGHAHNNFMQFLSGTGSVGFLLYLGFAFFYLFLSHRLFLALRDQDTWLKGLALAAIGAQVFLHVGGMTECNFKDAEVNHAFMFLLGLTGVLSALRLQRAQVPG